MVTKEDKLTRQINGVGNKDIMPLPEKPCIYPIDILSSSLFPTSLNYPPVPAYSNEYDNNCTHRYACKVHVNLANIVWKLHSNWSADIASGKITNEPQDKIACAKFGTMIRMKTSTFY